VLLNARCLCAWKPTNLLQRNHPPEEKKIKDRKKKEVNPFFPAPGANTLEHFLELFFIYLF
jgi:hypothetical protein